MAPVTLGPGVALPAGSGVLGIVTEVGDFGKPRRAVLRLDFTTVLVSDAPLPIHARVAAVDNARERIDGDGRILGPIRRGLRPGLLEAALVWTGVSPLAFGVMEAGRLLSRQARSRAVEYPGGVEATLELVSPLIVETSPPSSTVELPPALAALARAQPSHAIVGSRRRADVTNILFVGSEADIRSAFARAGWSRPDRPDLRTDARLVWALAAGRGYRTAPVSRIDLDGRPPDLVFEKEMNTISKRHHVRLWRRPETWNGRPVFVAAASHDVGLFFSRSGRRFTHHIDRWIDAEREKIVDDLVFSGAVRTHAAVDRPDVPAVCRNAVGDPICTDRQMQVIVLAAVPDPS
jgi:hypothetical protein